MTVLIIAYRWFSNSPKRLQKCFSVKQRLLSTKQQKWSCQKGFYSILLGKNKVVLPFSVSPACLGLRRFHRETWTTSRVEIKDEVKRRAQWLHPASLFARAGLSFPVHNMQPQKPHINRWGPFWETRLSSYATSGKIPTKRTLKHARWKSSAWSSLGSV